MRVPYISQRLTSFSDAPLYVNSPDRRSENYLTSDLIERDGRSIQSIAIDISMPMPMQGSKWKCQACKLEVKELENFFWKVIGRRKENNWDYLYTIAQLVKRVNGFEKYKKWAKLDPCFSFNKPTKQEILHFLGWSRPKFCTKLFSPHFLKTSLAKIEANVQKSLKGGSVKANFLPCEKK